MALTKRQLRQLLNPLVGEDYPVLTTAAGNAGGSTFEDTRYNGADVNFFVPWWALSVAVENPGKYAPITAVSAADPKVFTLTPALGVQILISSAYELHQWRPDIHTKAINRAIISAQPWLYVGAMDSSLATIAGTVQYTLPAGYTPENIVRVMVAGEGSYATIPYINIPSSVLSWNPAHTQMWWGRGNTRFIAPPATRTIYLFRQNPLTVLDTDATYGVLTNDTVAKVELDLGTPQLDLLLMFARAEFYDLLAAEPAVVNKKAMLDLAESYRAEAMAATPYKRMRPMERDKY